jgi:hypothetical protein
MKLQYTRPLAGLLAFAIGAIPLSAPAQSRPGDTETISGRVATINDADNIDVNDDRGYTDNVRLQQDTVIYPRGSRLEPGMTITIQGVNRGKFFAASQITISDQAPQAPQAPPQRGYDAPAAPPPPQRGYDAPPAPQAPIAPPPGVRPPDISRGDRSALPPQLAAAGDLTGSIGTTLDSKDAYVGETVQLVDVGSADGSIRGATLYGTVTDVQRPGQGRNAKLEMHFDRLRLANGTTYRIEGIVTQMQVSTKNNALKEAGGALAGMLAGNAIMKTLFGIGGGGLLGAIGGYFVAKDNRSDVTVPASSAISVRLLQARRQAQ